LFQVDIALSLGTPFTSFHHHLMYMLEKVTSKAGKRVGGGEGEGGRRRGGKIMKESEASSLKLCINNIAPVTFIVKVSRNIAITLDFGAVM